MSKTNKVHVVHMLRYGDPEKHSYILGVFSLKSSAQLAGVAEKEYRGGKYTPKVIVCVLDADMNMDEIYPNNWRTK